MFYIILKIQIDCIFIFSIFESYQTYMKYPSIGPVPQRELNQFSCQLSLCPVLLSIYPVCKPRDDPVFKEFVIYLRRQYIDNK